MISGDLLRAMRKAQGVTIDEMSSVTMFSKSHLYAIENGNRKMYTGVLEAYCSHLGYKIEFKKVGSKTCSRPMNKRIY